jgi:hypothetical protein
MKGRGAWFVLHVLLILGLLIFTLKGIFALRGYLFWTEILALLGLLVIGSLALMRYVDQGVRRLLFLLYIVGGLNVLVMTSLTGRLSWQALIIALVGAILSFPYARYKEEKPAEEQFNGKEIPAAEKEQLDVDVTALPEKKAAPRKRKAGRRKTKK